MINRLHSIKDIESVIIGNIEWISPKWQIAITLFIFVDLICLKLKLHGCDISQ